jgi:hypothetical protein
VNGILKASRSSAPECPVWDLHEPEIFAPCRELDRIRYAQGLPWDDTLVKVGLSIASLVDNALVTLEGDAERPASAAGHGVAKLQEQMASLVSQATHGDATSDLRRDATALLERLGTVVALRLAEAQAGGRAPDAMSSSLPGGLPMHPHRQTATGRRGAGRVRIRPR